MNLLFYALAMGCGGLVLGGVLVYFWVRPRAHIIEESARREADRIIKNAEQDSARIVADGTKQVDMLRENAQREETQMRAHLEKMQTSADERITKREQQLEEKSDKLDESRAEYERLVGELEKKQEELQEQLSQEAEKLSDIAKLSKDEAKEQLMEKIEKSCSNEFSDAMKRRVEVMRRDADEEASNIVVQSIQRFASSVTSEATISVVKIESDDLKGKIIGREGRNINAFEQITGVDVIVDDTPGTITLSCFDAFRRYVAKLALENLLKDGRIHPSRIEESVREAEEGANRLILELGQKAAQELGVTGFSDQILKLVGRLRFRTSYGQNVLQHSIEVAYLAEGIANHLPGADPEICKKAGLVHDIGKAVSHEVEGGHAVIGHDILKKFGVDDRIIDAMKSHHEDFPYETIESRVLQAADAISASRPGARRETLEKYLKRLRELEAIAGSFPGVDKTFAIQAGREVRVFVNAQEMDDYASEKLSFDVARKIEQNCEYPGEVRVAVIRENRFESVAK